MAQDISPEERLLRLIRSKAPKQAPAQEKKEAPSAPIAKSEKAVSESFAILKPRVLGPKTKDIASKIFRIENLNTVLTLLLIGLVIYTIPLFFRKPKGAANDLEEKIKVKEKAASKEEVARPPLTYFSQQIASKNIFSPSDKENAAAVTVDEGPKLEDVKSQFNLLGVVGGSDPQAIIEDKKTQKSYFLNKGAVFEDIAVKDILENKVILSYKDQDFELVL